MGGMSDAISKARRRTRRQYEAERAEDEEFNRTPAVNIQALTPGYAPLQGYAPLPGQGGAPAIPPTQMGQALRQPMQPGVPPTTDFFPGGKTPQGQAGNIDFFSEYI